MSIVISPNMSLPVPTVSVEPGPAWAQDINSCLSIVDQHNHSIGSGVQISQAGINLTGAYDSLNFNNTNAYNLRSVRFYPQLTALSVPTDIGCIYEAGVDLYYNDGNGNQIRLTQGGSIVGTAGSISGLPSGTASASYSAGTFVWQSATNTPATMDMGSIIIRNLTASAKGVTVQAPNALAANYSLTLPLAAASVTEFLQIDTSGNITPGVATFGTAAQTLRTNTAGNSAEWVSPNIQFSTSSGVFSWAVNTYVGVVTLAITTTGRPVMLVLQPDGSGNDAIFRVSGGSGVGQWRFTNGASTRLGGGFIITGPDPVAPTLTFIDTPAAGTYTYEFQVQSPAGATIQVNYFKLVAYEI